jgi:hypothetical protein
LMNGWWFCSSVLSWRSTFRNTGRHLAFGFSTDKNPPCVPHSRLAWFLNKKSSKKKKGRHASLFIYGGSGKYRHQTLPRNDTCCED